MASSDQDMLLGIYLNDHLAGSVVGVELIERLSAAEAGREEGEALRRLAGEVKEDREALLAIMATVAVPVRHYKQWAAWAGEKLGRVKPNGRLLTRSPLSRLLELEAMRLGVEGKAAVWRTLRARAERDARLDAQRLDDLITRASRQIDELEFLRVHAAVEAFGGDPRAVDSTPDKG